MFNYLKILIGASVYFTVFTIRQLLISISQVPLVFGLALIASVAAAIGLIAALVFIVPEFIAHPELISTSLTFLAVTALILASLIAFLVVSPGFDFILLSFDAFFVGAKHTADLGLRSLFSKVHDLILFRDIRHRQTAVGRQERDQLVNVVLMSSFTRAGATSLATRLGLQQALTIQNFDILKLSDADIDSIIRAIPNVWPRENHARFNALRELNRASCMISHDPLPVKFSEQNAENPPVLFLKQYKKNEVWHAVPCSTHIYMKNSISQWVATNAKNPVNMQESITAPIQYIENNVSHETRFVWHPYYLENAPNGVCQELNELAVLLNHNQTDVVENLPVLTDAGMTPLRTSSRIGGTRYSLLDRFTYWVVDDAANALVDNPVTRAL